MSFNPRIFRLFGADVHLHATFFIFAALFLTLNGRDLGWTEVAVLGLYYMSAFASILVHEYGHIVVARLHGIDCRQITLHGLGGFAHLDEAPGVPRDEFLIAVAGPITSLLLAALLYLAASAAPSDVVGVFLHGIALINVFIAVFNLVPAYPLDGGRMLHAVLQVYLSKPMADTVASAVAQALGVGLIAFGWHYSYMNMMLIGVILFFLTPSALGQGWMWKITRRS
ncbi:hypothetical protein G6L37_05105 [Agrobacterium rubi]|nr:hypothetical protein [Agrobacterium rubi]NTF24734.1 hypothetical protein [Agrobacterium rubi]